MDSADNGPPNRNTFLYILIGLATVGLVALIIVNGGGTLPERNLPVDETRIAQAQHPTIRSDYPTINKAAGADQIEQKYFHARTVRCGNVSEDDTANDLWLATQAGLTPGDDLKFVAYGIDPIRLKNEDGWIGVVVYQFAPGDPGVITTAAQYYLINSSCHILVWNYEEGPVVELR